jgi:hypothetical protein
MEAMYKEIRERADTFVFGHDPINVIANSLRIYFHWRNQAHSKANERVWLLAVSAYIMLLLPAVDLGWRVLQVTFLNDFINSLRTLRSIVMSLW